MNSQQATYEFDFYIGAPGPVQAPFSHLESNCATDNEAEELAKSSADAPKMGATYIVITKRADETVRRFKRVSGAWEPDYS